MTYAFHVFRGKQDLIKKLPSRFRGYRHWIPHDWIIMVLIDNDQEDCRKLKIRLEEIADCEGFSTFSRVGPTGQWQVINRLAIKELEAWFFGDIPAMHQAYPRISPRLSHSRKYRNPDLIENTWEALEKIFKKAGYYSGGLPKKEMARNISKYMDPMRNNSKSFQIFRDVLKKIHQNSLAISREMHNET